MGVRLALPPLVLTPPASLPSTGSRAAFRRARRQSDGDGTVPFEGSGARTHAAIPGSELYVVAGAPHGVNVSHAEEWNRVVLEFLGK